MNEEDCVIAGVIFLFVVFVAGIVVYSTELKRECHKTFKDKPVAEAVLICGK